MSREWAKYEYAAKLVGREVIFINDGSAQPVTHRIHTQEYQHNQIYLTTNEN